MISYAELRRFGGDKAVSEYRKKSKAEGDAKWKASAAKRAHALSKSSNVRQNDYYPVHI